MAANLGQGGFRSLPRRGAGQVKVRWAVAMACGIAAVMIGGLSLHKWLGEERIRPVPSQEAASTQPQQQPAAPSAGESPKNLVDLVRRRYPNYPATQPLDDSMPLAYAGHLAIDEPVHLDSQGYLWITRADAEPATVVLAKRPAQGVIFTREQVHFVHWSANENRQWLPSLVCPSASGDGFDLVTANSRQAIGSTKDFQWAAATSWNGRIVVPTSRGLSLLSIGRQITEDASPPLAEDSDHAAVQYAFMRGPIAWIPPEGDNAGSSGAVYWDAGGWRRLKPEEGWPSGLLHLVPMTDGSVLQLAAQGQSVRLSIVALEPMGEADQQRIERLISDLGDIDPDIRDKAYAQLKQCGRGMWPIAERMMKDEPPETQTRLAELLKARITPLLGDMELLGGELRLVCRLAQGGAVFHAEQGVRVPGFGDEPRLEKPAWLAARPGRSIELLPWEVTEGLKPGACQVAPGFEAEWIIVDEARGGMLHGSGLPMPLLRRSERRYDRFVGAARQRRYVFQTARGDSTLIIDPSLPDPSPRLPVWRQHHEDGAVGWDEQGRAVARQRVAWALGETGWQALDEKTVRIFARPEEAPAVPTFPGIETLRRTAGMQPTTSSSTRPADVWIEDGERPLLRDPDGTWYFGGNESLKIVRANGSAMEWPLPANARGSAKATLVRSNEGLLFLFNQPGRVVRIRPTPDAPEPFAVEAVFTRGIPNSVDVMRIWCDPSGRIIMAYEGNRLAVLFPLGYIPTSIDKLMTRKDHADDEE